jgi:membrane-associated HD superfamily phosphohydrolase
MQLSARVTGAGLSALGAILIVCGLFFPAYGTNDYEPSALQNAPLLVLGLLAVPALLIFVGSVCVWLHRFPLWLSIPCLSITVLAVLAHVCLSLFFAGFTCFDECPQAGAYYGSGFWLPLVGFLLSIIGQIVSMSARKQRAAPRMTAVV